MMNQRLKSESGFSLVELMVVVAIIGILAAMAIPQYQKFQAKAKQSEAKTLLAGLYTVEQTYMAENSSFAGCLGNIGFVPSGASATGGTMGTKSTYSIGFASGGTNCIDATLSTSPNTGACIQVPSPSTSCGAKYLKNNQAISATAIVNSSDFRAAAAGKIGGTVPDQWTIDQNKNLVNIASGI